MENMFCGKEKDPLMYRPRKFYRDKEGEWRQIIVTGYALRCHSSWAEKLSQRDCNECKHRLTCLLDSSCDRLFESK